MAQGKVELMSTAGKRQIVTFKKRNLAGQCRAMRCKETEGLEEHDRPEASTVLLCPEHHARAVAHNPAAPPETAPPVDDKPVARIATDHASGDAIYSLDDGATWAFGEPPDDEPEAPDETLEAQASRESLQHAAAAAAAHPDMSVETVGFVEVVDTPALNTTVVVEHADVTALVGPLATEYGDMVPQLANFVINDQATVDNVGELLLQVKSKLAALEKGRQKIVRPLIDAKKAVDDLFRPATALAKQVEGILKGALGAFNDRQQAAQVAALQAGQHEAALAVVQPVMPKGVSTVTVWKWKITDVRLIPANYLVVDSAKVQARVNDMKGACAIPGVEAFAETGVRAATK